MPARHLSAVRSAMTNPPVRSRGLWGACLVRSRSMMGVFIIFIFWCDRIETLFLHGGDVLQMRFHNGNGFIEKAFEVRVLRCGSFGFECLRSEERRVGKE